jgi:DNA-binding response OmpR family regulator
MNEVSMEHASHAAILCVESNARSREGLQSALKEYDYAFAGNAYEALRALHTRPFDAYVLDYWMPDWSGPLLCREIRKRDPHPPIVFCTEAQTDLYRVRALRAGASAYLPKPIDAVLLGEKLRALLKFAESENLRAGNEAERALGEELKRRGVAGATCEATAQALAMLGPTARSVERTARSRAYKAFIDSGGTRAQFERWWPGRCARLFSSDAVA